MWVSPGTNLINLKCILSDCIMKRHAYADNAVKSSYVLGLVCLHGKRFTVENLLRHKPDWMLVFRGQGSWLELVGWM